MRGLYARILPIYGPKLTFWYAVVENYLLHLVNTRENEVPHVLLVNMHSTVLKTFQGLISKQN